jgi:hypothetical protein
MHSFAPASTNSIARCEAAGDLQTIIRRRSNASCNGGFPCHLQQRRDEVIE